MATTIGYVQKNTRVKISDSSPNEHVALFGISGSGKSTRITTIVNDIASSGGTVIAFDLGGRDFANISGKVNRISAKNDGIDLQLFDLESVKSGRESYVNFLSYIVDTFTNIFHLGVRQQGALREAVQYALQNQDKFSTEMEAIAMGLSEQQSAIAYGVSNKLWQILHGDIFRSSKKRFRKGAVNIITFEGINPSAQKELTEILLSFLWRKVRITNEKNEKICLVIDEFHHFVRNKNSVLLEMLRESRKYGVNIILATQSVAGFFPNVLGAVNQTAVQLYFRPVVSDMKKIAEMIDTENSSRWLLKLKQLRVGESIATGNLSINSREVHHPLLVHSAYKLANYETDVRELLEERV